jgi:PAS domain S-box-containing protein
MAKELRKSGISVVGDVPWGTHLCHFYETKEDLLDILIPYFNTGLENNEFCVWVVSDPLGEEEAKNAFRQAVHEADRYLTTGHIEICSHSIFPSSRQQTSPTGRMEIVPHTEWYLKGGAFIAEQVLDGWNEKLADALARGYAGLRANGNEAWLTEENRKDFIQYEKTLDERLVDQRMIVLCSYPLSSSSAAQVFDVVNAHQVAVIRRRGDWEVLETPEVKRAKQEIQRLNEELEQRVVERTRELAAANEELRKEIAERKGAEEARRASETKFRRLLDSSIIGVVFWDLNGNLLSANDLFLNMTGYSREDLQQGLLSWKNLTPPEYAYVDGRAIAELQVTGTCVPFEKEYIRKDGSRVPVLIGSALLEGHDDKGSSFIMDITERKRSEEKLKQSENQLAEAQHLAHVGSWDWDLRTNKVTWSDEHYRIFGLEPGTIMVAGDAMPFIHPDDQDLVRGTIKGAVANKERYSFYYRALRPDGTERIVHSRGSVLTDERGEAIRVFGATQDVTELKQAEDDLKATTGQLRALSASLQSAREQESTRIARELHDELGGALTALRWDLEEVGGVISEATDSTQLADLRKKIEAMTTLTGTTLDTIRRLASELRPMALDELGLVEAIEWQALQFQTRTGIAVEYKCSQEKVDLNSEQSTAVFRILQETLTNVLRHAQATEVTITMKQESGEFFLAIKDNGRGITESEKSGAHSLGLLGMRERANLIGAQIDIIGIEGKGTLVAMRIPISESSEREKECKS